MAITLRPEAGREIGYAEITTNFSTASGTPTAITGLSTTVTVAARPIRVCVDIPSVVNNTNSSHTVFEIREDGSVVGVFQFNGNASSANQGSPASHAIRRAPAAGSHTYAVYTYTSAGGTVTVAATAALFYLPSIHVFEI